MSGWITDPQLAELIGRSFPTDGEDHGGWSWRFVGDAVHPNRLEAVATRGSRATKDLTAMRIPNLDYAEAVAFDPVARWNAGAL